jgi:hypothetical protein
MPDISMCSGKKDNLKCPLRETCYRFTAKPDRYQDYFEMPYDFEKKECAYHYKR